MLLDMPGGGIYFPGSTTIHQIRELQQRNRDWPFIDKQSRELDALARRLEEMAKAQRPAKKPEQS